MKVVLAEACAKQDDPWVYARTKPMDPINLGYLGAIAKRDGHEVAIVQQRTESLDELTERIVSEKPDIVGFTAMTWNFSQTKDVAVRVKKRTRATNIFGGYHISAIREPDVAREFDDAIDYAVLGEGESTFSELLKITQNGGDSSKIPGLAFRKNGELIITEPRPRIEDLSKLPWPIRNANLAIGSYPLAFPAASKQKGVFQVSYSRGCPNRCSYCASPEIWGGGVVYREAKDVVDEIEALKKKFGTNFISFTDLTFNFREDKVNALCDELEKRNLGVYWAATMRPSPNKDLFRRVKSAGCTRVPFGLEAVDDLTLDDAGRKKQTIGRTSESLSQVDELGLFTMGYLMLGWPKETGFTDLDDYVKKQLGVLKEYAKAGLDILRISFLTPFPGTPLYGQCKRGEGYEFLTRDFSKFDSNHPVIKHPRFTPEQLYEAKKRVFWGYFESEEYSRHVTDKISRFPKLKEAYQDYFSFLRSTGINVRV